MYRGQAVYRCKQKFIKSDGKLVLTGSGESIDKQLQGENARL
ncbi:MAG: hypothetical protein ACRD5J_12380 [Nitrososphaeraceae archaeon]